MRLIKHTSIVLVTYTYVADYNMYLSSKFQSDWTKQKVSVAVNSRRKRMPPKYGMQGIPLSRAGTRFSATFWWTYLGLQYDS